MSIWKRRSARHDKASQETDPGMSLEAQGAEIVSDRISSREPSVEGERDLPSVNSELSLRARLNNLFAIATVLLVGGGFLTWYYAAMLKSQAEGLQQIEKARVEKAAAEMKLPPLKGLDVAGVAEKDRDLSYAEDTSLARTAMGPPPPLPATDVQKASPPTVSVTASQTIGAEDMSTGSPAPPPSPEQIELARKLTPSVLFQVKDRDTSVQPSAIVDTWAGDASGATRTVAAGTLGNHLAPTATPAVDAQLLSSRPLVLPKGNFIDCTLETAIDSQLPGLVTCITAFDIFGADGKVILIERGSKLIGESKGEAQQGMNRIFVLWTEARTPTGVVVQLASPGTDALGRAGLPGRVDSHFMERFGAAILISVIDGAVQAAVESQRREGSGSSVVVAPQTSRDIMTETLRNTINIPPTIVKNQGDRIQVIVARNVDFRNVYELRTVHAR